jgi:hypothetical protein
MNNTGNKQVSIMKQTASWREKTESIEHVLNIQYLYLLNKYIKCNVWRLAVRYDSYKSLGVKGLKEASKHSLSRIKFLFPSFRARTSRAKYNSIYLPWIHCGLRHASMPSSFDRKCAIVCRNGSFLEVGRHI